MNVSQSRTISSSGTRLHPGNPPRSQPRRNHRHDRSTIWRELSRTQDSEYSGIYISFVATVCWVRDGGKHLPRDRLDLGDFAWIQQGVRGTTECCPDIESYDEFSRKASVGGAGCVHGGSQRKAVDGAVNPGLSGNATLYRYITGMKGRSQALRLIPSRTRKGHFILMYAFGILSLPRNIDGESSRVS